MRSVFIIIEKKLDISFRCFCPPMIGGVFLVVENLSKYPLQWGLPTHGLFSSPLRLARWIGYPLTKSHLRFSLRYASSVNCPTRATSLRLSYKIDVFRYFEVIDKKTLSQTLAFPSTDLTWATMEEIWLDSVRLPEPISIEFNSKCNNSRDQALQHPITHHPLHQPTTHHPLHRPITHHLLHSPITHHPLHSPITHRPLPWCRTVVQWAVTLLMNLQTDSYEIS